MTPQVQPVVELVDVSKTFKVREQFRSKMVHAVRNVSFQIDPAQIWSLVGESGSGKSTIGRMLMRNTRPSSGDILLEGDSIWGTHELSNHQYWNKVQMVFQDPYGSLNPSNTLRRTLYRPLINYSNVPRRNLDDEILKLLESVGLTPSEDFLYKRPNELSGGQRQRVVLARALAVKPKLVVADEPISMLDVSIKASILSLMERLRNQHGIAYLYITHDLTSAYHIADRIGVLYAGSIVEQGTAEEVIRTPKHPYSQLLTTVIPDPHRAAPPKIRSVSFATPASKGCVYAPRCPLAMPQCFEQVPPVVHLSETHSVACYAVV